MAKRKDQILSSSKNMLRSGKLIFVSIFEPESQIEANSGANVYEVIPKLLLRNSKPNLSQIFEPQLGIIAISGIKSRQRYSEAKAEEQHAQFVSIFEP